MKYYCIKSIFISGVLIGISSFIEEHLKMPKSDYIEDDKMEIFRDWFDSEKEASKFAEYLKYEEIKRRRKEDRLYG